MTRARRVRRARLEHRLQAAERRQGKGPGSRLLQGAGIGAPVQRTPRKVEHAIQGRAGNLLAAKHPERKWICLSKDRFHGRQHGTSDTVAGARDTRLDLRALELGRSALTRLLTSAPGCLPRAASVRLAKPSAPPPPAPRRRAPAPHSSASPRRTGSAGSAGRPSSRDRARARGARSRAAVRRARAALARRAPTPASRRRASGAGDSSPNSRASACARK